MVSMASQDISKLLAQWPYEQGKLVVRLVDGEDGEQRIQVRLDLGVIQMHTEGRPDGQRPRGFDSLLEYHEARLDEHIAETGSPAGFVISGDDCRDLREEAAMYYRRYTSLWVLDDYEGVVRDTTRNLRVLDLLTKYAEHDNDKAELEGFRPYITMMRAKALATLAIRDKEPKAALHAIDEALESLREFFGQSGSEPGFDGSPEVQMLRGMRDALIPKLPLSQKAEIKRRMDAAIKAENYELAAILRDELRGLGEGV